MNQPQPSNESQRPLITFALFAYNQEQFIAEAVQGALAQTYTPLEIILSDDCSPDRTFDIIQEIVAAYEGSHTVILNRNQKNLGLVGHINYVMEMVQGELVVVAAGDDISLPHRTTCLVQSYLDSGKKAFSIHSYVQKIDEYGNYLKEIQAHPNERFSLNNMADHTVSVIGNSHAWHRNCFDLFGQIDNRVISEDVVIPFRAALLGKVNSLSEILVLRRYHKNNMWLHPANSNFKEELLWHRERLLSRIDNLAGIWETKIADLTKLWSYDPTKKNELGWLMSKLERRLSHIYLEREFYLASWGERVKILPKAAAADVPLSRVARWVAQYGFPAFYYGFRRLQRSIHNVLG